jgi:hypothetical protein
VSDLVRLVSMCGCTEINHNGASYAVTQWNTCLVPTDAVSSLTHGAGFYVAGTAETLIRHSTIGECYEACWALPPSKERDTCLRFYHRPTRCRFSRNRSRFPEITRTGCANFWRAAVAPHGRCLLNELRKRGGWVLSSSYQPPASSCVRAQRRPSEGISDGRPLFSIPDNQRKIRYECEAKMIPAKKPPPRLGDIPGPADLARRTDRMDGLEMRLARIESRLDALVDMMKPVVAAFGDKGHSRSNQRGCYDAFA